MAASRSAESPAARSRRSATRALAASAAASATAISSRVASSSRFERGSLLFARRYFRLGATAFALHRARPLGADPQLGSCGACRFEFARGALDLGLQRRGFGAQSDELRFGSRSRFARGIALRDRPFGPTVRVAQCVLGIFQFGTQLHQGFAQALCGKTSR